MKKTRIVNLDLIEQVKQMPCLVCEKRPSDAHHVSSVGSGGSDTTNNLMNVCRRHHSEIHQVGWSKACSKYPIIRSWLEKMGRDDILERMEKTKS